MSVSDAGKAFLTLVKRLRAKYAHAPSDSPVSQEPGGAADGLVDQMVFGFMLWESSSSAAKTAFERVGSAFVDYNELRIALPEEIASVLGDEGALGLERATRLRASLRDVYGREHSITLAHVSEAPKREAWSYLRSLEGMPQFVAARLLVFGLGGHAAPVDRRLASLLHAEGACPEGLDEPWDIGAWLERQVRANEAGAVASVLQSWSDDRGGAARASNAAKAKAERTPKAARAPKAKGTPASAKASGGRPKSKGG
ncbi:MAG: hypothetical protein HRU70_12430 [Phycisphaeraceae bacterium]|nr:MAG: hypothetical protein HRU70_12430 [Phycisphaeraceae bacterium]